jgi:hypothetical protein
VFQVEAVLVDQALQVFLEETVLQEQQQQQQPE